jgi:RNA recognition motif-containing protein
MDRESDPMKKKLFVGGLAWATDEESLRGAFGSYGEIKDVRVIRDPMTNRSRGFGFVEYNDEAQASAAKAGLDGTELDGRRIRVDFAQDRGAGGGGGGGGGRGPRGGGRDRHDD